jgi:ribosomal protein L12E/L44/L45/RPP1/RPP2
MLAISRLLAVLAVVASLVAAALAGRALWLGQPSQSDAALRLPGYYAAKRGGTAESLDYVLKAAGSFVDERRFDSLAVRVQQLGKALDSLRAGRPSARRQLRAAAPAPAAAPTTADDAVLLRSEMNSQREISAVLVAGLQRDIDRIASYNQTILVLAVPLIVGAVAAALSSLILAIRAGRPPAGPPPATLIHPGG